MTFCKTVAVAPYICTNNTKFACNAVSHAEKICPCAEKNGRQLMTDYSRTNHVMLLHFVKHSTQAVAAASPSERRAVKCTWNHQIVSI